jgi:hypothetical protein
MEMATSSEKRKLGLYQSNSVAAFEHSEQRDAMAARITDCVVRAFHAIGASSQTQEIVFWNLFMIKNVGRNEVMDKPAEFIEGLRGIYGEAGTVVFESMLKREIRREFDLTAAFDNEDTKEGSSSDLIRLIRIVASESPDSHQGQNPRTQI